MAHSPAKIGDFAKISDFGLAWSSFRKGSRLLLPIHTDPAANTPGAVGPTADHWRRGSRVGLLCSV